MSKKKLVIGIDLDSTVCDLLAEWLGLYNEEYGVNYTAKDIHHWEVGKCVPIGSEIYKYLDDPGLYKRLNPYSGAIESLQRLHEDGHELHILTAPSPAEQTAADKLWWAKNHLPFIPRKRVTLIHEKHRFLCDVLIDDAPHHILEHRIMQPTSKRCAMAFPYNESISAHVDLLANSFENTVNAWLEIENFVYELSRS